MKRMSIEPRQFGKYLLLDRIVDHIRLIDVLTGAAAFGRNLSVASVGLVIVVYLSAIRSGTDIMLMIERQSATAISTIQNT